MKKILFTLFVIFSLAMPLSAQAMDLSTAKDLGYVGETTNGLIASIPPHNTTELKNLVAETNQGRMTVYKETANKQGIAVSQVQAIAAQKLMNMAAKGHYIQLSGAWVKK